MTLFIHLKNYFVTVFSVISFQFIVNKRNLNTLRNLKGRQSFCKIKLFALPYSSRKNRKEFVVFFYILCLLTRKCWKKYKNIKRKEIGSHFIKF